MGRGGGGGGFLKIFLKKNTLSLSFVFDFWTLPGPEGILKKIKKKKKKKFEKKKKSNTT